MSKLSPAMIAAITSTPDEDGIRFARTATINALASRGLAQPAGGTSWFTLTEEGQAVAAELTNEPVPAAPVSAGNLYEDHAALNGDVVKEGHAKACARLGHVTRTVDGQLSPLCARCDEVPELTNAGPIYPFDMTVPALDDLGQRDPNEEIDDWEPRRFTDEYPELAEEYAAQESVRKVDVTVTDVALAEVEGLVQLGKQLVWGKLIDVVRRGHVNMAEPDLLVTVEVAGVRRLVKADHYLAA